MLIRLPDGPAGQRDVRVGATWTSRLATSRLAPFGPVLLALAGCAYLAGHNPNDPAEPMPVCPTKLLTGLDCPACGSLRMVYALLHGRWSAAVHDNVVMLACAPLIGLLWLRWTLAAVRGRPFQVRIGRRGAVAVLTLAVVWMVVRNLPGFPLRPGG